jgi:hypothetical protein
MPTTQISKSTALSIISEAITKVEWKIKALEATVAGELAPRCTYVFFGLIKKKFLICLKHGQEPVLKVPSSQNLYEDVFYCNKCLKIKNNISTHEYILKTFKEYLAVVLETEDGGSICFNEDEINSLREWAPRKELQEEIPNE